ncbi:hypothetical protein COCON_G00040680 [Conger conger]|uniref:Uncharacterized protein n=1 Tax=Conger conger TaxID=82655 RepID=A0A9Q1I3U8_CONCO|nr:hypothetical protein COCON_G00040680 [Conger conger]
MPTEYHFLRASCRARSGPGGLLRLLVSGLFFTSVSQCERFLGSGNHTPRSQGPRKETTLQSSRLKMF